MMFERFTDTARHVVVHAQADARRLGHGYIGCEHLLLAAAAASEPASAVLRDQGVTPERIEAEILRAVGRGQAAGRGKGPADGVEAPSARPARRRGARGNAPLRPGPAFRGHIPFTPRAKKSLELSGQGKSIYAELQ
jgi:Clp amino terminal domain, pathogenicity island component